MKKTPRPFSFASRLRHASTAACQALLIAAFAVSAQAETQVYHSNGSFLVPSGVTRVTIEAWGGGGGGGYDSSAPSSGGAAGGGGGGGGYSKRLVVPVTPGRSYSFTVGAGGAGGLPNGAAGGDSSFVGDGGVTVLAKGGAGGSADLGGNGGSLGVGDDDAVFAGGKGGDGSTNAGGGGGGAARVNAAGTSGANGSGNTGGNGGAQGGGKGGNKKGSGQNGSSPGAGGGGMGREGSAVGNGAAGRLLITYTVPGDEVQTGTRLNEEDGMAGGGVLYRPMPGVINADGSYALQAFAKVGISGVTASNDEVLLSNRSGALKVVAREGSPLPGGGYLANGLLHLAISGQGNIFAVNNVRATPTVGAINGTASLLSTDGVELELIKRKGGLLPAGGTLLTNVANLLPYGAANFSYVSKLAGAHATRDTRVDSEHSEIENPVVLACEGEDVSSITGDPAWLGEIGRQFGTGGGEVAFVGRLQNNPANAKQRTLLATNEAVFCVSSSHSLKQVLRKGAPVPDTEGFKIQIFNGLSRSLNSKHAVHVTLDQPLKRTINQALLHEDAGMLRLVAQMGVTEITAGLTVSRFGQYYAANDGSVVFTAWLAGAPLSSDGVLCRWTLDGGIEVIAREGDAAPHTDRLYGTLTRLSVSPSGVVLFQATLTGVGGNGIVYRLKEGVLEKLVRVGDDITFDGESTKVLGLGIYDTVAGGGSSARAAVNDAGQALVALSLGNGRHVNRVFE